MLQSICVVFFSDLALIKVSSYPGVHDQFAQRESIENICKRIKLLRIAEAEPCFDRDLHAVGFGIREDVIQKTLKGRRVLEKSRALAFGTYGSGRTPEIQIYLFVSHCPDLSGRFDKMVRPACEDLGDKIYPFIILGSDFFSLPGRNRAFFRRGNEWREVLVHVTVDLAVCIPEYTCCNAFERGEVIFHEIFLILHNRHFVIARIYSNTNLSYCHHFMEIGNAYFAFAKKFHIEP